MASKAHPSWARVGTNTYSQPYGFQEVLYDAISVSPGSPGLFLIGSSVTFRYSPSAPYNKLSSYQLAPLLRNAWLQLRQQYPTLAAENQRKGKLYTSPLSPADLEAWLAATFFVVPGKTWTDVWRSLVKTKFMTLYYLPDSNQLFVQGEHHTLDGRGMMNFWDRFFGALASPWGQEQLMLADGSEVSRLPPRSDDLLDTTETKPGRGEQRALEILGPLATMSAPISIPVARPLPPCSRYNSQLHLTADARTTEAITAACKAQHLSVTAVWHLAVVLATQAIQASRTNARPSSKEPYLPAGRQFATFGNFDLRRYFPAADPVVTEACAVSNHHGVLPYVLDTAHKTFAQMAGELAGFYQQDLPAADPEVWSALGPMIRAMVPEFTKGQLDETTPAVSSLGVVDGFVSHEYVSGEGVWAVEDVWFGDTVTGPWLEHFMWAWKGRLVLNTCYNEAYYSRQDVDEFNEKVLGEMLRGLGVKAISKL